MLTWQGFGWAAMKRNNAHQGVQQQAKGALRCLARDHPENKALIASSLEMNLPN